MLKLPWDACHVLPLQKIKKPKTKHTMDLFQNGGPNKNYIVLQPLSIAGSKAARLVIFFFFGGEISTNFNLKNMISTYAKDFAWKIMTQIYQIKNKIKSKSPDFYNKFQKVANNIKGFWFFFYFHTQSVAKSG